MIKFCDIIKSASHNHEIASQPYFPFRVLSSYLYFHHNYHLASQKSLSHSINSNAEYQLHEFAWTSTQIQRYSTRHHGKMILGISKFSDSNIRQKNWIDQNTWWTQITIRVFLPPIDHLLRLMLLLKKVKFHRVEMKIVVSLKDDMIITIL